MRAAARVQREEIPMAESCNEHVRIRHLRTLEKHARVPEERRDSCCVSAWSPFDAIPAPGRVQGRGWSQARAGRAAVLPCSPGRADGELSSSPSSEGGTTLRWTIDGIVRSQHSLTSGSVLAACWMENYKAFAPGHLGGAGADGRTADNNVNEVLAVLFKDSLVLFDNSRVGSAATGDGGASGEGGGKQSVISTLGSYRVPIAMFATPFGLLVQGHSLTEAPLGHEPVVCYILQNMYGDLHRIHKAAAAGGDDDADEFITGVSESSLRVFMYSPRSQRHRMYVLRRDSGAEVTDDFDINTDGSSAVPVSLQLLYTESGDVVETNVAWSGSNEAQKVVEVNDYDGCLVVCYLKGRRLELVKCHEDNTFEMTVLSSDGSVVDIESVASTREYPMRDLLILRTDGTLELHSIFMAVQGEGRDRVLQVLCSTPPRGGVDAPSCVSESDMRLVGLQDPIDDRVTCLFSGEGEVADLAVRSSLRLRPRSMLVNDILQVLRSCLSPEEHHAILIRIIRQSASVDGASLGTRTGVQNWEHIRDIIVTAVLARRKRDAIGNIRATVTADLQRAAGGGAWEELLRSKVHEKLSPALGSYTALGDGAAMIVAAESSSDQRGMDKMEETPHYEEHSNGGNGGPCSACACLESLHALYEDYKLDKLKRGSLSMLNGMLVGIARELDEMWYVDHYLRDFGDSVAPDTRRVRRPRDEAMRPANIQRALLSVLQAHEQRAEDQRSRVDSCCPTNVEETDVLALGEAAQHLPPLLSAPRVPSCLSWSRRVVAFYGKLDLRREGASGIVEAMIEERFDLNDVDRLPVGVALPIREALHAARDIEDLHLMSLSSRLSGAGAVAAPQSQELKECRGAAARGFILIGREDLAAATAASPSSFPLAPPYSLFPRPSNDNVSALGHTEEPAYCLEDDIQDLRHSTGDGMDLASKGSAAGADGVSKRSGDVSDVDGMEGIGDGLTALRFPNDNRVAEVKDLLTSSSAKTVSLSNDGQADAEPEQVAALQARLMQYALRTCSLPVGRGAFTLGASAHPILTEPLPQPKLCFAGKIPSQHNAIVNLDMNSTVQSIVNLAGELLTWPEFHNGVASGLRLTSDGQAKLARTWVVYNRHSEASFSHAGLLMALGLNGHLRVLATTDIFRYLGQCHDATTVGVLIGMAASKRKSLDSGVSKTLFLHIPTQHPSSYPELELSPHVQAAALMGVGLLYEGSAHRLMTEILVDEIGRRPGAEVIRDREGYSLAAGLALGLVTLGKGRDALGLTDLRLEDRLTHLFTGQGQGAHTGVFGEASPTYGTRGLREGMDQRQDDSNSMSRGHTMEGSLVNLDVTAPGAILALGLMYMKTNDANVADRLRIPDTHFALVYVRPDFIYLRMVARSLVMWDSIEATEEFVRGSLPAILRDFDPSSPAQDAESGHDVEALANGQVQGLAGACMALGLKYAGSANEEAEKVLTRYVQYFLKRKREVPAAATPSDNKSRLIDRSVLEMCLNSVALALAVVMSGTGHLPTLRILRYLHRRLEPMGAGGWGISYGNHMAINMAIGFLFMGAGTQTFGTSNSSIAALVIALFPRFPSSPNDNRCHLQAFRHMYVLAAEQRCVTTIDVDTGKPCFCPLEIEYEPDVGRRRTLHATAPSLVPEQHMIRSIRIGGSRYLHQRLDDVDGDGDAGGSLPTPIAPGQANGIRQLAESGWTIAVKRKIGSRPYEEDPTGNLSLVSRTFSNGFDGGGSHASVNQGPTQFELLSAFASDPNLLGFAKLFSTQLVSSILAASPSSDFGKFVDFCRSTLYECVVEEKPLMLYAHLELFCGVMKLVTGQRRSREEHNSQVAWDLRLCTAYYEAVAAHGVAADARPTYETPKPLLKPNFLKMMMQEVRDLIRRKKCAEHLVGGAERFDDAFCAYCILNDVPWHLSVGMASEVDRDAIAAGLRDGSRLPSELLYDPSLAAVLQSLAVS